VILYNTFLTWFLYILFLRRFLYILFLTRFLYILFLRRFLYILFLRRFLCDLFLTRFLCDLFLSLTHVYRLSVWYVIRRNQKKNYKTTHHQVKGNITLFSFHMFFLMGYGN